MQMDWRPIHLPPQIIMGCDNYLLKETFVSNDETGKTNASLIKKETLWISESWKIGEEFATHYLLESGQRIDVDPSELVSLAVSLRTKWEEADDVKYADEIEDLDDLVGELEYKEFNPNENFYYSLDY